MTDTTPLAPGERRNPETGAIEYSAAFLSDEPDEPLMVCETCGHTWDEPSRFQGRWCPSCGSQHIALNREPSDG